MQTELKLIYYILNFTFLKIPSSKRNGFFVLKRLIKRQHWDEDVWRRKNSISKS